jgi:hypothetical protein
MCLLFMNRKHKDNLTQLLTRRGQPNASNQTDVADKRATESIETVGEALEKLLGLVEGLALESVPADTTTNLLYEIKAETAGIRQELREIQESVNNKPDHQRLDLAEVNDVMKYHAKKIKKILGGLENGAMTYSECLQVKKFTSKRILECLFKLLGVFASIFIYTFNFFNAIYKVLKGTVGVASYVLPPILSDFVRLMFNYIILVLLSWIYMKFIVAFFTLGQVDGTTLLIYVIQFCTKMTIFMIENTKSIYKYVLHDMNRIYDELPVGAALKAGQEMIIDGVISPAIEGLPSTTLRAGSQAAADAAGSAANATKEAANIITNVASQTFERAMDGHIPGQRTMTRIFQANGTRQRGTNAKRRRTRQRGTRQRGTRQRGTNANRRRTTQCGTRQRGTRQRGTRQRGTRQRGTNAKRRRTRQRGTRQLGGDNGVIVSTPPTNIFKGTKIEGFFKVKTNNMQLSRDHVRAFQLLNKLLKVTSLVLQINFYLVMIHVKHGTYKSPLPTLTLDFELFGIQTDSLLEPALLLPEVH